MSNKFLDHLDNCVQCREHPFQLCPEGEKAMVQAVGEAGVVPSEAQRAGTVVEAQVRADLKEHLRANDAVVANRFYNEVCDEADLLMLKSGRLASAHFAALKIVRQRWNDQAPKGGTSCPSSATELLSDSTASESRSPGNEPLGGDLLEGEPAPAWAKPARPETQLEEFCVIAACRGIDAEDAAIMFQRAVEEGYQQNGLPGAFSAIDNLKKGLS
jgi:hypothetical protein